MQRSVIGWVLLAVLGLSLATFARAQTWQNELALWTDAVKVSPHKPRPFINLGLALEQAKDWDGALQAHQTAFALAFQPRLSLYQQRFSQVASETNIARILAQTGHEVEAERMLTDIVRRHPAFSFSRWNYGVLLARTGRCAEAIPQWQAAMQLDPAFGPMPTCIEPSVLKEQP